MKGSYLRLLKTFASFQPVFWSRILETNLGPLRYELGPENVHQKATDVSFHIGDE
jgi:hypothetical protein